MTANHCMEIQQKIDKVTNGLEHPMLGDKMIEIVHPYSFDYLKIAEKALNANESILILQHPFFQWINRHESIKEAYELLSNEGLITEKDKKTPLNVALEFILANTIHYLIGSKFIYGNKTMRRAIVPPKKKAEAVTKALHVIIQKLNLHQGIYCKIESKQYLLRALIEDILSDQEKHNRSIFSSGITKNEIIRELLTKRIIHGLYALLTKKQPRAYLVAQIALKISQVFYKPMDVSDAAELAKEIHQNFINDEKFRQQCIQDYLISSIEKG